MVLRKRKDESDLLEAMGKSDAAVMEILEDLARDNGRRGEFAVAAADRFVRQSNVTAIETFKRVARARSARQAAINIASAFGPLSRFDHGDLWLAADGRQCLSAEGD